MPAEYTGRAEGHTNGVTRLYPVADGVTVTSGDFVSLVDGRLALPGAGAEIFGVVEGGDTEKLDRAYNQASTGNAAGTVKVLVNIEKDARWLVKTNGVRTAADEGDLFNVSGATGAQVAAPGGVQLICLQAAPMIRGSDNTHIIASIANNQRQS